MSLTRLAVHRPVSTLMACLVAVLLGWVALSRLAVDLMPEATNPMVSVVTLYRGAGPSEIETLITRPLEQALASVRGVERLSSSSTEGSSTVRVQLQWGTNIDAAVGDMRSAIEKVRRYFPQGIEEPYIRHFDVADFSIMQLGLSSDLTPVRLTQLAEQRIVPRLERLDGVARVMLRGSVRREIHVDLNRAKLEALDLGVNEVVAALDRENSSQPAGDLKLGEMRLLVRSQGEFVNLNEIANTVVRQREGAIVRIGDIADVIDGEEERTEHTRVNGRPGMMVYVYKQSGANTVAVSDRVRGVIAELNTGMRNEAQLAIRIDQSEFIRQAIGNVRLAAVYGMGLAVVVLIVFLRSFRSTLVIAVSMPLSVLATFVLIYFQGFTLNMVSFGGLALGIGLLVDNSIVVLESIYRKREEGLDAKAAAIEGTQEVASAIVASTLTTLIVFLPMLFVHGTTGVMLHQLAWVVSFSLICSLLVSLTLTPMLTAQWDRPAQAKAGPARAVWNRFSGALHGVNHRLLRGAEAGYERALRGALRGSGLVAFLLLTAFTTTVGLTPRIGTEFLPKADEGDLRVEGVMAPGVQLDVLNRQSGLIEQAIQQHVPEAAVTVAFIGDRPENAERWHYGRFRMQLSPRSERARRIDDIRRELADQIGPTPGMRVRVQTGSNMGAFGILNRGTGGSGSSADVLVEIRGHDLQTAEELADAVGRIMHRVPGLINIDVEKGERRPELAARIDRTRAGLLGVSVRDVTQALETTVRGTEATVFREGGDEFHVVARLRESDRSRISDVEQVGVATPSARIVPLKNLVTFEPSSAPMSINRLDQQRYVTVSADIDGRDLGSVIGQLQDELAALPLPPDFSLEIAGDWEEQQKSFSALKQSLLLALVLMYAVMASQFESLRDPLLILVSVPLGAVGVVLMLVLTGTTLNVQSFIGLVMLAGIVVNNAIVLVDYINQLRRSQPEADLDGLIVQAGVRRFRPILMTTATTVLAMTPIALGWGEGGELQAPMARVVIGGLLSGTLISLLAIPLLARFVHRPRLTIP